MLDRFKVYLQRKGTIKTQYIPFYVRWVSECYSFLDASDSTPINSDQKKQFLTHIAKSHEDWQVKKDYTGIAWPQTITYHNGLYPRCNKKRSRVRSPLDT